MTSRVKDINGFYEVKDNPISKVGVFPYSGAMIGLDGLDPNKLYNVLRPAGELSSPETIESFKLIPWIDDHTPLGADGIPAEEVGVEGTTGEEVTFSYPYLKSNIKVYSEDLKQKIESGKDELSAGYRCEWVPDVGIFDGQEYQFVQRKIRGNHLATVDKGRMGPDVAVLDHDEMAPNSWGCNSWALDEKGFEFMEKEEVKDMEEQETDQEEEEISADNMLEVLKKMSGDMGMMRNKVDGYDAIMEEIKGRQGEMETAKDEEEKTSEDEEETKKAEGMDEEKVNSLIEDAVEKRMEAFMGQIGERDKLASNLKNHIGAFDHSEMTLATVAKYGVKKLKIPDAEGTEIPAIKAWLHGRAVPAPQNAIPGFSQDSKNGTDSMSTLINSWGKE